MNLGEALQILGIEKYLDRIFNSNSHGELFHLQQYFHLAEFFKEHEIDAAPFARFVDEAVKLAEQEWSRPESVFQHIESIFLKCVDGRVYE